MKKIILITIFPVMAGLSFLGYYLLINKQAFIPESSVESLPYTLWAESVNKKDTGSGKSVTINREDKTFQGLNFYNSRHKPESLLIDMDGKVMHRWHGIDHPEDKWYHNGWFVSKVFTNGDIIALSGRIATVFIMTSTCLKAIESIP